MLIFENSNLEIHDVGSSTDPTLTPIEVTDGTFDGGDKEEKDESLC